VVVRATISQTAQHIQEKVLMVGSLEETQRPVEIRRPDEPEQFTLNAQLLEILIRAGASIRNPDVLPPVVRSDRRGRYLELRIAKDPEDESSYEYVRRIQLDELDDETWNLLKEECAQIQLQACRDNGLKNELEKIGDEKIRKFIYSLFMYLTPRQMVMVLYMHREASRRRSLVVDFAANDLLETLGYTRQGDGSFPSKYRAQLHRDLVDIHRTEIYYTNQLTKRDTKLIFKSIMRIKTVSLRNLPRDFDIMQAAEDGCGCGDIYTVEVEPFEDGAGAVLFSGSFQFAKQHQCLHTSDDYATRLLIFLGSRMRPHLLKEGKLLTVTKRTLYSRLELFGKNGGRNNKILWDTIQELKDNHWILGARELPKASRTASIEFEINLEKLRPM
jgi:hypothetical protein